MKQPLNLPQLAVTPDQAAKMLSVSRDFFDERVSPELQIVQRGRRRLIPTKELERWMAEEATLNGA